MKNLINDKRKTFTESYQFEMVENDQALNLQGGLKNEDDLFSENMDVKIKWHKATSLLDDLV